MSQIVSNRPDGDEAASSFQTVPISRLLLGGVLKYPIRDDHNVLLLSEGQTLTAAHVAKLRQRGIQSIRVHEADLPLFCACEPQGTATSQPAFRRGIVCPLHNKGTERLDEVVAHGFLGMPPQEAPFAERIESRGKSVIAQNLVEEMAVRRSTDVAKIAEVFRLLADGRRLDLNALTAVATSVMSDMERDADVVASIGINPFGNGYPSRHSLHTCMAAILIGTKLDLDLKTLWELAIGSLLHDAGMLRIDVAAYTSAKKLSAVDFLEVTKHPVLTFDILEDLRAVTSRSALIAYQIHERCDGSGYPRGRKGTQIHSLSKVAAVADAYVGMVSPRPHRPAAMPYYAMTTMLQSVKQGLFDSTCVRGLLRAVSLFPLGSYVQLSDGRVGRVIRSNGDSYMSPVVEAWPPDSWDSPPEIVDLTETDVKVTRPMASRN